MDRVISTPPPGFVKVPRSILAEDWAGRPQTLAVFIRLLLSANREAKDWHGITIKRGQFVTSLRSLSKSCGLTVSAVRTALDALQKAGFAHLLTRSGAHSKKGGPAHLAAQGYTIVTICKFDSYEGISEGARTPLRTLQNKEATRLDAQSLALTKEDKEIIDISAQDGRIFPREEIKTPGPLGSQINLANIVTDSRYLPIVEDWLSYKRERRETYKSKRGLSSFYSRLFELSHGDPDTARRLINTAMANNWAGVFPERAAFTSTPRARGRIDIPTESAGDYESTL